MTKASNLVIRLATAVVAVPGILALLYVAPPWAFYALVFPAAMIGCWELLSMTHGSDKVSKVIGLLFSAAASLLVFFEPMLPDDRALVTAFIAIPVLGPVVTLLRLGDIATAATRALAMSVTPFIVAVPMTLLAVMQYKDGRGPGFVLLALGVAWLGDTGGYFAGRFLGKRKLYEAVSPKKTIAGAVGGLAGSTTWAVVCHFFFIQRFPLHHAIPLAIVGGALGQAGDLGESLIKRSTGVKDSGQIVPGHGGILDRVDALLMTSTVVFLYTLWFR